METSIETQTVCPICKNNNTTILYKDIYINGERKFSLRVCKICSHAFTNPFPPADILEECYNDNYYSYDENIENHNSKFKYRLKVKLYQKSGLWKIVDYLIRNQMAIAPLVKYGKLLDIGCGSGAFLSLMKSIGYQTYGTEISQKAVNIATRNGHNVFLGDLIEAKYQPKYFDVITLNNVLEHLDNPHIYIKEIFNILKDNGELIICVPNFDSFSRIIFQEYWGAILIPQHLQHFNIKSLKRLLENNEFHVTKTKFIYRELTINKIRELDSLSKPKRLYKYLQILLFYISLIIISPFFSFSIFNKFCTFITVHAKKRTNQLAT